MYEKGTRNEVLPLPSANMCQDIVARCGPAATRAQECHPAYGGCLPYYEGDALKCVDIGYQVVEVWDVYNDPYRLDDWDGLGNGWTCDSNS